MDDLTEIFAVEPQVNDTLANLQLPDPMLLNFYKDTEKRMYFLEGDICDDTLELVKFIIRCNLADKDLPPEKRKPIYVYINSLGGDVQILWTVVNVMQLSKTPIYTVAYCNAMSAAAYMLVAGHKRFALPGSTILVHSGSCSFNGDVEKVESAKKFYDGMAQKANALLLSRTTIPPKDLKRKGASDWYMTAEEALSYNMIDELVTDLDTILP